MRMVSYHFNSDYSEIVTLADGPRVSLRLVRPEDKVFLEEGLHELSETSRYRRFFTAKQRLSPNELTFLTEVDGINHFAMGALHLPDDGPPQGVGIARFIRMQDRPDVAEPAIVVVDSFQGKGLGGLLFRRLIAAARERDVRNFRCEVLATNEPVKALLRDVAVHPIITHRGTEDIIEFELPVPTKQDSDQLQAPLNHLFAAFAGGQLLIRNTLSALKPSRLKGSLEIEDQEG
jgi:GNAT superfamily N-acetyltransferase